VVRPAKTWRIAYRSGYPSATCGPPATWSAISCCAAGRPKTISAWWSTSLLSRWACPLDNVHDQHGVGRSAPVPAWQSGSGGGPGESAGTVETSRPVQYWTVKERVTVTSGHGHFLIFEPADPAQPRLTVDCAVDFPDRHRAAAHQIPAELSALPARCRGAHQYALTARCCTSKPWAVFLPTCAIWVTPGTTF
jgi:hypothetical protein